MYGLNVFQFLLSRYFHLSDDRNSPSTNFTIVPSKVFSSKVNQVSDFHQSRERSLNANNIHTYIGKSIQCSHSPSPSHWTSMTFAKAKLGPLRQQAVRAQFLTVQFYVLYGTLNYIYTQVYDTWLKELFDFFSKTIWA